MGFKSARGDFVVCCLNFSSQCTALCLRDSHAECALSCPFKFNSRMQSHGFRSWPYLTEAEIDFGKAPSATGNFTSQASSSTM